MIDMPIGAIIPWLGSLTNCPELSDNWIRCNGTVINDVESPLNGQTTPNLNGENRTLVGDSTTGTTLVDNYTPGHVHTHRISDGYWYYNPLRYEISSTGSSYAGNVSTVSTGTAFVYYSVIYIMRIK